MSLPRLILSIVGFLVHQLTVQQVPIKWEEVSVTPILQDGKTVIPADAIQSVRKNTVALKGVLHKSLSLVSR